MSTSLPSPRARALTLAWLAAMALGAGPVAAQPVVVELFQAQGCSSCPPANDNLASVADRPDIIALSFGVTYWDHGGWRDTFAQERFTDRQWDYARSFRRNNVFTPQVVVDGVRDGVGADPREFARLIAPTRPPAGAPTLSLSADAVTIGAGPAPSKGADVWMARYDPRVQMVSIRRGENGGKTLPHKDIVRQFVRVGAWTGSAETLKLPPASDPALKTAILVQLPRGGPILAAAKG
jgi:hypothetical protein